MKFKIEFRNQQFDIERLKSSFKIEPSFGKVGLPKDFLSEAAFHSVDSVVKIPLTPDLTDKSIEELRAVELAVNFLLFKGAKILTHDFTINQVTRHV